MQKKVVKVEFALIDEIDKNYRELVPIMDEAEKLTKQRSRLKGKARTLAKKIIKEGKEALKALDKLGLPESGTIRTLVAYANNSLKDIEKDFPF